MNKNNAIISSTKLSSSEIGSKNDHDNDDDNDEVTDSSSEIVADRDSNHVSFDDSIATKIVRSLKNDLSRRERAKVWYNGRDINGFVSDFYEEEIAQQINDSARIKRGNTSASASASTTKISTSTTSNKKKPSTYQRISIRAKKMFSRRRKSLTIPTSTSQGI